MPSSTVIFSRSVGPGTCSSVIAASPSWMTAFPSSARITPSSGCSPGSSVQSTTYSDGSPSPSSTVTLLRPLESGWPTVIVRLPSLIVTSLGAPGVPAPGTPEPGRPVPGIPEPGPLVPGSGTAGTPPGPVPGVPDGLVSPGPPGELPGGTWPGPAKDGSVVPDGSVLLGGIGTSGGVGGGGGETLLGPPGPPGPLGGGVLTGGGVDDSPGPLEPGGLLV
ncbi:MAG: hypothetical protein GEV28_18950, partial [Actinophytocola sp.]|nr:hypothetical protein [Actinophytocola sp.]